MAYVNRPSDDIISQPVATSKVVDYHDRVRWGPIISGLVVALATQLILTALFSAIGLDTVAGSGRPRTISGDVARNVGIWSVIGLLISLFTGGWFTTRACGPMNRSTALLNGAILWATTLALSSWLLANGVTSAFGFAASTASNAAGAIVDQVQQPGGVNIPQNVPSPNVTASDTRAAADTTASGLWWFVFGSLLGLIASMIGAAAGARSPRNSNNY